MAHDHDHDHGKLTYQGTTLPEGALAAIEATHPALAAHLAKCARHAELTEEERKGLADEQRALETATEWTPGYHSAGDKCATCGQPTHTLFRDRFAEGALPYAAFARDLPVHPTRACLDGLAKARPDASPRGIDRARRELTKDLERPSARMSMFFRHDVLAHPPFGLEDWANSVAEANPGGLDRTTGRDIQRLVYWVHGKLFHS